MRKQWFTSIVLLAPMSASAATQILVPAYFDPSTSNDWNVLTASVSATVPITAIMNPENGPVATASAAYTTAIASFQAAGGKVIAYVHTTDGSRSLTTVENDVATYKSEYPNINGIFVDEMANTTGKLSYYKSLYTYIKSENANWQVTGNPGTDTLQSYLSPTPAAADVLVTFENSTGYSTYTPPSWQYNFSAGSFANIAYAQPDVATMQSDLSLAAADHAGSVYFTDATGSNPYTALPSYWSQEVAAVQAINLKSTYIAVGSGDYKVTGNWSAGIPNSIGAEADFLGSITASHTVYSDTAVTVGKIVFNNSNTYVLAGAGSLTLQTSGGSATIDAQAGTQKITLPITVASNAIFSAEAGATLVIAAPVVVKSGQTLTQSGAGQVTFLTTVTVQSGAAAALAAGTSIQSLVLASGSSASIVFATPDAGIASQINSLSASPGSLLDLHNNGLIVHDGDLAAIIAQIKTGTGISSSSIASDSTHLTGMAVITSDQTNLSSFDGTAVVTGDVLIKEAELGDTDLNGVVDAADYGRVNAGFTDGLTGWYNGDFNYDGVVNGSDYALMDNSYNTTQQAGSSDLLAESTAQIAVPEPSGLGVLVASLAGFYPGFRRRHR